LAQQVTVTAKGLWLAGNDLSEVPDGALAQADNVVISKDGIVEQRRGIAHAPASPPTFGVWTFYRLGAWKDDLVTIGYESVGAPSGEVYISDTGVTSWSSLTVPGETSIAKPRFQIANGVLYYTLVDRIGRTNKTSSPTTQWAGYASALDVDTASAGAGTAVSNNTSVAYRIVWGYRDSNGAEILGAPSGRSVFTNTSGGTVNVTVVATTPPVNASAGVFYRVYRSAAVASTATPSDELGLVYEATYGGGSGSTVTFTDIIPPDLTGATIYTAPSQQGIANANYPPPTCQDVAYFKGAMFYANCANVANGEATLIDVNAATGMTVGDTVTVASTFFGIPQTKTYTAAAAENIAAAQFLVSAGGTAANIATTAQSLVRVINRHSWTGQLIVAAEYLSGADDQPGIIRFYATISTSTTIDISCSRASAFIGMPIVKSATQDRARLCWSKQNEPDAVPLLNYSVIGDTDSEIKRIVATRDALFIFKADGIGRLTGSGGVWDIQPLDPTMSCPAPESLVAFENAVYGLLDSGVAKVTESGVEMISGPIYPALETLLAPANRATLSSVAFGIAYHSAHKYIMWLPSASSDTMATQAYVYDSWTNAWTRWLPPTGVTGFYHGLVNPADDRLYMVDGTNVWQERKMFADTDFQDSTSTPIPAVVKYTPKVGGNPGQLHQFREAALVFRRVQFGTASVGFSTNVSPAEETIALTGTDYGVNSAAGAQTTIRALVPLEKARGSQLNVKFSHSQAGQPFQLQGLSVVFTPGSTRVSR